MMRSTSTPTATGRIIRFTGRPPVTTRPRFASDHPLLANEAALAERTHLLPVGPVLGITVHRLRTDEDDLPEDDCDK